MSSTIGRSIVAYKVNKSGGGVIKGDVVVPDTSNDNAFTTTTSAAATTGVWVADETIANNATGRVVLEGHVTLVNVSASVTRGHTGTTHTVAKQAVSTGAATRTVGTFCKFTTGGTTPEADIWPVDLLGSSLTNPMTTAGDIIYGGASGTPTRLAAGTAGYPLVGGGAGVASAYAPVGARRGCLVYHNTTQSVNGTFILANSEIYDSDGYHSTVTNTERITIPTGLGGLYLLEYGSNIVSLGAGEFCRISLNGAGNISPNEGETDSDYLTGFCVYPLVPTDYVRVIFTGNRTVGHASAYEAQFHFSATLLGT